MKSVLRIICIGLLLVFSTDVCLYAEEKITEETIAEEMAMDDDGKINFNFKDANIKTIINYLAQFNDLIVIMDEKIKGKITVATPKKLTLEGAFQVLMAVLDIRGLTIHRTDKFLKVREKKNSLQKPVDIYFGVDQDSVPDEDRVITAIIPLEFAKSSTVMGNIRPLVSKTGNTIDNKDANYLIITDVATNIRRIMTIISYLDIDETKWGKRVMYKITFMKAKDVGSTLEKLFKAKKNQKTEKMLFTPVDAINSLVVTADEETHTEIKEMITTLDIPVVENERPIVYNIKYMKSKEMGGALEKVFSSSGSSGSSQREENIKITPVESVNALVVTASVNMHEMIKKTIDDLDIRRRQVLIEVKIVEVTLSDNLEFGVNLEKYAFDMPGSGVSTVSVGGTVAEIAASSFFTYSVAAGQLEAALGALAEENRLNVLSSPRILTSDNQTARISVGQEQPILKSVTDLGTESSGSGKTVSDYVYKDVGIELEVTPRINVDRDVSLDIEFKITSILSEKSFPGGVNAPVIGKREAKTNVSVMDGRTLVIGGLMKSDVRDERKKIPILGDIPFIGMFFSSVTQIEERTELLVFITPHVVANVSEGTRVTKSQSKELGIDLKEIERKIKEKIKEKKPENEEEDNFWNDEDDWDK